VVALISRLTVWLGAGLFSLFGAWKVFFSGVFLAFLGVTLFGLANYIIEDLLGWVIAKMTAVVVPELGAGYSFTGFVGWGVSVFKIPECMAFIIAMVTVKWTMRKIPLIRW
jgi:hypothetical protein